MAHLRLPFVCLFLVACCFSATCCNAFTTTTTAQSSTRVVSVPGKSISTLPSSSACSPIVQTPLFRRQPLFMTDDASKDQEEDAAKTEEISEKEGGEVEAPVEETRGIAKTLLLVPLFCKFVVVLVIKFITDLIVFPLLFLYRLAGQGKRKFYKMIGKGPEINGKPNGET